MTRTKEKVPRGANEGSFKWVQIKYQLNNASRALIAARNKKSMTGISKKNAYISIHI